jgi:hypothetical protein
MRNIRQVHIIAYRSKVGVSFEVLPTVRAEWPRSPFRPGMGLEPPYLGDRDEQIQRFREFLEEPQGAHNVLVTGLRGVGKTVLLNNYSDLAETANWVVADREWNQNDGDPVTFRQLVLEDLARLALKLSVAERVKKRAEDLARALRGALSGLGVAASMTPWRRP